MDAYNVVGFQQSNKKYRSKAFATLSRAEAFGEPGRRSLEDDLMEYSAVRGVKARPSPCPLRGAPQAPASLSASTCARDPRVHVTPSRASPSRHSPDVLGMLHRTPFLLNVYGGLVQALRCCNVDRPWPKSSSGQP